MMMIIMMTTMKRSFILLNPNDWLQILFFVDQFANFVGAVALDMNKSSIRPHCEFLFQIKWR